MYIKYCNSSWCLWLLQGEFSFPHHPFTALFYMMQALSPPFYEHLKCRSHVNVFFFLYLIRNGNIGSIQKAEKHKENEMANPTPSPSFPDRMRVTPSMSSPNLFLHSETNPYHRCRQGADSVSFWLLLMPSDKTWIRIYISFTLLFPFNNTSWPFFQN